MSSRKSKKKGHEHKRKDGHTPSSSHHSSPGLPDDDDTPLPPPDELPPELPEYGSSEDDKSEPLVSRSSSTSAVLDSGTESGSVSAQIGSDENSNTSSSSCGDESEKHKSKDKKKKKRHTSKNLSTEPSPNKTATEHGKQHSSTFVVMPPTGTSHQDVPNEVEEEPAPSETKAEGSPEEKPNSPEQPHTGDESGSQLSLDSQYCARLPSFRSCDSTTSDGLSPTSASATTFSLLEEGEITTTPLALVPLVGKVYESWPTLDMVLDDPILKATFFTFLQSEYALENVLFYEDVVHYRLQYFADPKGAAVAEEARRIYKDYFTEDSEYEINVSWETKKALKALFEGGQETMSQKDEGSFPASVWDEAMNEVMSLLHTDLYVRWYNCMQPPMIDPVEAKLLERRKAKVGKRAGFSEGAMRFLMVKETVRVKAIQQLG